MSDAGIVIEYNNNKHKDMNNPDPTFSYSRRRFNSLLCTALGSVLVGCGGGGGGSTQPGQTNSNATPTPGGGLANAFDGDIYADSITVTVDSVSIRI